MSENWRYQKISILKFAPPTKNDNFLKILAKNLTNFDPKNRKSRDTPRVNSYNH